MVLDNKLMGKPVLLFVIAYIKLKLFVFVSPHSKYLNI